MRAKCAGAWVFVCRGNFVGGRSVKSVACESGMTSLWLAHAVHNLRNHFGRFTTFGEACRRSRSRASMCNDMVVSRPGRTCRRLFDTLVMEYDLLYHWLR